MRRLLAVLTLVGAVAAPAAAAPDLASVTVEVHTVRESGALKGIAATVTVQGERIVRADLTPPGGATVALALEGETFVLAKTFTSEQDLATAFPDGEYRLTLNGTTDVSLGLARPPVPSPAISFPLPGAVLVPGAVTVEFTRCTVCDQELDTTEGTLKDEAGAVIASDDTLGASQTSLVDAMTPTTTGAVAVADARVFPSGHPFEARIGSERLVISRLDDEHVSVLERGANGTTAAGHAAGDRISEVGQSDTTWTPAADFEAEASFTATVVHSAVRAEILVGGASDDFELVGTFTSSDSVPFFTGAAVPAGSFCLTGADDDATLDPLGECLAIGEPSAALIDPSGAYALSVPGVEIEYDTEVSANGAISGEAHADLDGNGSFETTAPVRGKLSGFQGKVERHLAFAFRSAAPAAKLTVRISEQASIEEGSLGGHQRAKGKVLGEKLVAEAPSTLPLGDEPLGWRLDVVLAGKHVEDATITLEDGRVFALRGRFIHDFLTGLAKLDLRSEGEDAGVWVRFEDLEIEDLDSQPPVFGGGDFTFRILGQRGRINPLP